jgi:hypothetical protein
MSDETIAAAITTILIALVPPVINFSPSVASGFNPKSRKAKPF